MHTPAPRTHMLEILFRAGAGLLAAAEAADQDQAGAQQ